MTGTWLAVAAGIAAMAAAGVWGYRNVRDLAAYFVASRRAGAFLAGIGGTAAGLSAFVFIGGPGLFAAIGVASLWLILSAPLTGALQCWVVGEPIVGLADSHGCLTVPGLVAARFGGGWAQGLAAAAVAVGGIATLAVQVKGIAVAGSVLLDMPGWLLASAALLATTAYTATGGMRAGLLAEASQGLLMGGLAVVLALVVLGRAGGPAGALHTLRLHRPELLRVWGGVGPMTGLGWFLLFGLGTCAQPHYLQKFLLLRNRRALRWMPAVMTGALISILTVWVGLGLGGAALVAGGGIRLTSPDALAPTLIRSFGPWLVAAAVTGVIAAVMSTAATLLNMIAAVVVQDLPAALGRRRPRTLAPARWATIAAAALALVTALASHRTVALLGVLGWGTFTAAFLPTMVLGLNWEGCTRRGAIAALAAGPAVQLALELARARGMAGTWEPGLSGAAVGTLLLVALSLRDRGRSPRATLG